MTDIALAQLLGVSREMIRQYKHKGVSKPAKVDLVEDLLGLYLRDETGNPRDGFSTLELLREVERRLEELEEGPRPQTDLAKSGHDGHGLATPGAAESLVPDTFQQTRGNRVAGMRRGRVAKAKGTDDDAGEQEDR